jgi:hypothetical protein
MASRNTGPEDSRQTSQRGHVSGVGRPEEFVDRRRPIGHGRRRLLRDL